MAHLKCDFQNYAILHSDLTRKKSSVILAQQLTCSEHASDVGVPLVEAFLYDGVDEGRAVEEHSLVALKRPQKWALFANDWLKS